MTLYDFDIVYLTGKSNLVTDTLSCRPEVKKELEKEIVSDNNHKWIAVSYQVGETSGYISSAEFNQAISKLVGGTKIDKKPKARIHTVDLAKENWMVIPSKLQQVWSVYLTVSHQRKWQNINTRRIKSHQSLSMSKKTKGCLESLPTKSGQSYHINLLFNGIG